MSKQAIRIDSQGGDSGPAVCRLNYRGSEIQFAKGEYVLGRSAACDLILDDALVSRRHARLTVGARTVSLEDLESINGTFVNGEQLRDAPRRLQDGDRLIVGSEELDVRLEFRPIVDDSPDTQTVSPEAMPKVQPVVREKKKSRRAATTTGRVDALELLGNIADKALAMGRFQDADRVLGAHLRSVLDDAKSGRGVLPQNREIVSKYAIRFAVASGDGRWFDYVVDLFAAEAVVCTDSVIIELQVALDKVSSVDLELLERYIEALGEVDLDAEETRRVQRLDELLFLARNRRRG